MNKVFPKEGEKKLKATITNLRSECRSLKKKIKFLEDELINIQKPIRTRKDVPKAQSDSEWRSEFAQRFKETLKRGNNE